MGLRDGQQIPADHRRSEGPEPRCSSPCSATRTARTPSAASSARPTAARPGRRCCTRTRTPAAIGARLRPVELRRTIYAVLWAARQGPWENGAWQGPGSGLFKSTDGGDTWKQLTKGLPTSERGPGPHRHRASRRATRNGSTPSSMPRDAAASIAPTTPARRWQRGQQRRPALGPRQRLRRGEDRPEEPGLRLRRQHRASTARPTAGKTFTCIRGAPGGDDYHTHLDQPGQPRHHAARRRPGRDHHRQRRRDVELVGTTSRPPSSITSSPTTGSRTGSTAASRRAARRQSSSRGNDGQITFRDWHPVGVEEYGYVAPDPLEPGHHLRRQDHALRPPHGPGAEHLARSRSRRQVPLPAHRAGRCSRRSIRRRCTSPATCCSRRRPAGTVWDVISPDLSRETAEVPASIGVFRTPEMATEPRRGVIYTVAPSYKEANTIWAGTDDGLIHVTRDGGKNWTERHAAGADIVEQGVAHRRRPASTRTPPTPPSTASGSTTRSRTSTARTTAARRGRRSSAACRTSPVNAVREDPVRKGLLYRRHRTGGVRLVQRRRRLAAAAAEHAGHVDPRPGGARGRRRRRHARPVVLDSRRHHAAAATHAAKSRRRRTYLFRPPVARPRPLEHEHGHAAAARGAARARTRRTGRSSTTA